ncbi:T9SS type A sorting domain-containing protein [Psychroserpens burtonensis]|uniref:T9SS type A sorting domain-containing protein n=1 Tax=Psychroserpens burtonensis TaxID=49278 RepID=A0A5C7BJT3_9FLAO|nr:T9SS type A sorting domain-containing protein [Psychroserpens burtonensis]TXE19606.1 T9SS type A sorting domain-containing protein [Psychroserpens burtonensis]
MIKHILFLVCLASSLSGSAQLTVTNSSYIFVDGNGFTEAANVAPLFVTGAINLNEADSKIYLRNEAQIIQGNTASTNSGVGQLSVQQTGNTNQWAYNYWCSPVGNNSAAAGNESARVGLIDESIGLTDSNNANFTSGHNGTASPLTISNRWLYAFVVSDEYSEWNGLDETTAIDPGLGFTMKGMGTTLTPGASSQQYDFRGKPNSGTITNSVAAGQFTLVGNPYPSALDAADFLWDSQNTNIDEANPFEASMTGALYYWEQSPNSNSHYIEDYVGGYATYTCTEPDGSDNVNESFVPAPYLFYFADGTASSPPGNNGGAIKAAKRYIPIGQGFMVEGAAGIQIESFIYVKNSHRDFYKESSSDSEFFRTSNENTNNNNSDASQYDENGYFLVSSDYKRFRFAASFNGLYSREILANFHDTATNGFDYGMEGKSPSVLETDIHWTFENEDYVIQAHSFNIELKIPLVVKIKHQQPVTFGIFDIQNFDASQPIYVHDIENDIYVDLREQNYSINLPAGDYTTRFEITFQNAETLDIENITAKDFMVFQNTKNSELTVLNPNGLDIKSVTLFDITGKIVINAQNLGAQNDYSFSTQSLSEGVYVANITVASNQSISKKVVIKN